MANTHCNYGNECKIAPNPNYYVMMVIKTLMTICIFD